MKPLPCFGLDLNRADLAGAYEDGRTTLTLRVISDAELAEAIGTRVGRGLDHMAATLLGVLHSRLIEREMRAT